MLAEHRGTDQIHACPFLGLESEKGGFTTIESIFDPDRFRFPLFP